MRLQEAHAAALLAPGAADYLVQQLEGALGSARSAIGGTEVGIDDADQIELREMMALGDKLRPDHDVDEALLDLGKLLAHALDAGNEIAGENENATVRKERCCLLLQPL